LNYSAKQIKETYVIDLNRSLESQPNFTSCRQAAHPCYARGLPEGVMPADFIGLVKKLFAKNNPLERFPKSKHQKYPKIPLVVHQIWFGGALPKVYDDWNYKLRKLHPGWTFIRWTEEKIRNTFPQGFYNQKMFDDARERNSYAKMSDIARYEILHKYGGLYLDYDVKCLQPLDFLHDTYDFYAGMEDFWSSCYCCNAVIGARKGHPIIQACIEQIKQYENKEPDLQNWPYKSAAEKAKFITLVTTGPKMFTQGIWQAIDCKNNIDIIFPPEVFYAQTPTAASLCHHSFHSLWHGNLFENY
jgi:mannosyltransferase OCH1-like enzyme